MFQPCAGRHLPIVGVWKFESPIRTKNTAIFLRVFNSRDYRCMSGKEEEEAEEGGRFLADIGNHLQNLVLLS
jgi:hypothetical protein